jgi:hypothetical protein
MTRKVRSNPAVDALLILLGVWLFLGVVMNLSYRGQPVLKFDNSVQVGVFATIPLLLLTVLQLRTAVHVQKAGFIRDYVSKLHIDKELSEAYHYLVSTYTNELYERVIVATDAELAEMQGSRGDGCRLYNVKKFQGSQEERRLDALLGYFDLIGYHYLNGVVRMGDIAGVLGYQLSALTTRKVIHNYLDLIPPYWEKVSFGKAGGVGPFRYLTVLLDDFIEYNKKNVETIQTLNRRKLIGGD